MGTWRGVKNNILFRAKTKLLKKIKIQTFITAKTCIGLGEAIKKST